MNANKLHLRMPNCYNESSPSGSQKQKKSYTVEYKLEAVNIVQKGGSIKGTARKFGVQPCRIRDWVRKKEKLKKTLQHSSKRMFALGRPILSPELDKRLYMFMDERQSDGCVVTAKLLQLEALEIARMLNLPESFRASPKYLRRWKRKYIGKQTVSGTKLLKAIPSDYNAKLEIFQSAVAEQRRKCSYLEKKIVSVGETQVCYTAPLLVSGTNCNPSKVTVLLSACADGTKLPACVVLLDLSSSFQKDIYNRLVELPENISVHSTSNGLVTKSLMLWWIDCLLKQIEPEQRSLLILDSGLARENSQFFQLGSTLNCDPVFVPKFCSPLCNPVNVGIIRPFSLRLEELRAKWMQERMEVTWASKSTCEEEYESLQSTTFELLSWISTAWNEVSAEEIKNAFVWCGICKSPDGNNRRAFEHVPYIMGKVREESDSGSDSGVRTFEHKESFSDSSKIRIAKSDSSNKTSELPSTTGADDTFHKLNWR